MSLPENEARAAIVAEARRWVGTPYHPNADILGVGVDCGMLIVRVYCDTGLVSPFDPRPYSPDWHLHRSEERYLGFVMERGRRVEAPQIGDVMVFRYGRCYAHGAIVSRADPLTLIHALIRRRHVIEEPLAESAELNQPKRSPRFYSLWGG